MFGWFKKKRFVFLVLAVFFVSMYLLVWTSQNYVREGPLWPPPLNDRDAVYEIDCSGGLYRLVYEKEDDNRGSLAAISTYIASSPDDLEEFCNKQVEVYAKARKLMGKPLCTRSTDLRWCENLKTPVVDILDIQAR